MLPPHLAEPLRWAYANGWRPKYPRTRRDGLHIWYDADRRLSVRFDIAGHLQVRQLMNVGWVQILDVRAGCWQQVLDALTIHGILPARFNTAYLYGVQATATLTVTRARLRALQRGDLLTLFAAIDHSLRNGGRMTGANLAFALLCKEAGVDRNELVFDPHWVRSDHTFDLVKKGFE